MALNDRLMDYLAKDPSDPAVEVDGIWRERGELIAIAEGLERRLAEAGVAADAGVGLVARNQLGHIAAIVGLMARRRTVVMIHAHQPPAGLAAEIERLRLPVVIAAASDWAEPVLQQAAGSVGTLALSLDSAYPARIAGVPGLDRIGAGPFRAPAEGIAVEMLSSGTTGAPKQTPISWRTMDRAFADLAATSAGAPPDPAPHLQFYPLGNISGVWGVVPALAGGRRIVLFDKFSMPLWLDAVRKYRPTAVSLPPPAIQMLFKAEVPVEDLASIRIIRCGSGKLDPDLQERFEDRYGIRIFAQYGATEFCGVTVGWVLADHEKYAKAKRGSTGRAWPGVELRIVDPDTGAEVPTGELGRIEVKVLRVSDDWVRTTDIGRVDEDGFLFVEGRADFVINRGGFKVAPETVAQALRRHPGVGEAVVVGAPDERLTEVPVAAVEVRAGAKAPTEAELLDFVRETLPRPYVPVRIFVLDALPKTSSMKVDVGSSRTLLKALARPADA